MSDLATMTPDQAAHILRRVRAQCVLDGFCWIWQGSMKNGGSQPQANISPWRGVALPRLVFAAQHGRAPLSHLYVVPACGNRRCLACLEEVARRTAQQRAAEQGAYSHPVALANRAAAARRRCRYGDAQIEQARDLQVRAADAARATGMSPSYVRSLRAGACRLPNLGMWGGLGA